MRECYFIPVHTCKVEPLIYYCFITDVFLLQQVRTNVTCAVPIFVMCFNIFFRYQSQAAKSWCCVMYVMYVCADQC